MTALQFLPLETLPIHIARIITLELDLNDYSVLLRTSPAVFALFWTNGLPFAIKHVTRRMPPKENHLECPRHRDQTMCRCGDNCAMHKCDCADPKFDLVVAADTNFRSLPPAYAVAVFVHFGFNKTTFPVVFSDAWVFHVYYEEAPCVDPRWIETVVLQLVKQRLLPDRSENVVQLLIHTAVFLDSVDLASAILEWLTSFKQPSENTAVGKLLSTYSVQVMDDATLRLVVAYMAAIASEDGAVGVLAFALNHPCRIDPWNLPWIDDVNSPGQYQFRLDKTLLLHATSVTDGVMKINESVVRLLLDLPLPLAPLKHKAYDSSALAKGHSNLNERSRIDEWSNVALEYAVRKGDTRIFQLLGSSGADYVSPGQEGNLSPLAMAAAMGHKDLVMALLDMEGVDVNNPPGALYEAVCGKDISIIRELLVRGALVDSEAMFASIMTADSAALEMLLDRGGDPNCFRDQASLLSYAVSFGDSDSIPVCKILLSHGADVHRRDAGGRTALHSASSAESARLLIEAGAAVDARDDRGWTPLHCACDRVCIRGFEGVWRNVVGFSKLLLEHGCDVNALTHEGHTPLDLVQEGGSSQELRDLLCRHGARETRKRVREPFGIDLGALD
ncbi:hypothetical protein HDU96_004907 [Phlyctochytrium bullatum]|nr:hypothetical protein HDU96_004907 [Phlyctochytrium bullatum]